uniref:Uncharacterized protein n=1 Tax=Arundo donax TaxID=35708 RepID=A0A0A9AKR5_ARUDO
MLPSLGLPSLFSPCKWSILHLQRVTGCNSRAAI